jgi:hypothetical protein
MKGAVMSNLVPVDEAQSLVAQAQAGDSHALSLVIEQTKRGAFPLHFSDPADQAARDLIAQVTSDPLTQGVWHHQAVQLREELEGPDPSPLVRLLARRAVLCWLQCHVADLLEQRDLLKPQSMKEATFWRERQDAAHKRFLSACKTLAQVRKLAVPMVQVNISERAINVQAAG